MISISPDTGDAHRRRAQMMWYVRIGAYLVALAVVWHLVSSLRGRIPMAFGLTPIQVKVLSMHRLDENVAGSSDVDMTEVSVNIRLICTKPVAGGVRLSQFRLLTTDEEKYAPYASTLVLDAAGTLDVTTGDTVIGALLFSIPANGRPDQLWWRP